MGKRVLDVGNCTADHCAIKAMIENFFEAEVVRAHGIDDALSVLHTASFDLVLVNRKLDRDYHDGLDLIQRIKADATLNRLPVMMITNFAEHQETAVAAGAEPGFGKQALGSADTIDKLKSVLDQESTNG